MLAVWGEKSVGKWMSEFIEKELEGQEIVMGGLQVSIKKNIPGLSSFGEKQMRTMIKIELKSLGSKYNNWDKKLGSIEVLIKETKNHLTLLRDIFALIIFSKTPLYSSDNLGIEKK